MKSRIFLALIVGALVAALTWIWDKTRSIDPEEHGRFDSALRELRSLDRTINQDVLRARYQLIDSYLPVLKSYRRIEELEAVVARPLPYLDAQANHQLAASVTAYRTAVTAKQDRIERFKYRSADLKELLNYLPGAGTGVAQASRDQKNVLLAENVNHVLQLALLYNLTSDESYSPVIAHELDALATTSDKLEPPSLKRRVRTLITNTRRLLKVKPAVDRLLVDIFAQPVIAHEEQVATIYARGYTQAEHMAQRYRLGLYALSLCLFFMVAYSIYRLRRSAIALVAANASLERRVSERTRELAGRNQEMRVVLDNVDQALFTVDMYGFLARERSAALDQWFPNAAPATPIWEMFRANEQAAEWLRLGWDQLRDNFLPIQAVLDQLPPDVPCGRRHYQIRYIPIDRDEQLEKVLLVVSDVTERVVQAQKDAEQQELGVVFRHLLRDRVGFYEFFAESQRLVDVALNGTDAAEAMRAIHTLKGNASMYGLMTLTKVTGELETGIVEHHQPLDSTGKDQLQQAWSAFSERVRSFTEATSARIELHHSDIESLRTAVASGATQEKLLRALRDLEREPAERRLTRISEQTKLLARRLGKADVVVVTEANDVRLDSERWAPFWSTFVHMLRNAIDHGIEPEDERSANGKNATGQIWLSTKQVADNVVIEIRDDGRGIDWDAVRTRASKLGLVASSDEALAQVLYRGGLSTKTSVSEYSGRGTGLSACYDVCRKMGGTLSLTTVRGKGTSFQFTIPSEETAS